MSRNESNAGGSGVGFLGLLAITFIALKLTGYIDWPWWAVLAPIWAPFALLLAVLFIAFIWFAVKDGE